MKRQQGRSLDKEDVRAAGMTLTKKGRTLDDVKGYFLEAQTHLNALSSIFVHT